MIIILEYISTRTGASQAGNRGRKRVGLDCGVKLVQSPIGIILFSPPASLPAGVEEWRPPIRQMIQVANVRQGKEQNI